MIDEMLSSLNDYLSKIVNNTYKEHELVKCHSLLSYYILGRLKTKRYQLRYERYEDFSKSCACFFFAKSEGKFNLLESIYSLSSDRTLQKRVLLKLTSQIISNLFYEADSISGKLYRNIRIAVKHSETFDIKMNRCVKYIMRKEDKNWLYDVRTEIEFDVLLQEFFDARINPIKIGATLKFLFRVLDKHSCKKSISVSKLLKVIRALIFERFGQECVEVSESFEVDDYLVTVLILKSCKEVTESMKILIKTRYVQTGKIDQSLADDYIAVIQNVIDGMFFEEKRCSKSEFLRKRLGVLSSYDYRKHHVITLDYFERLAKNMMSKELKKLGVYLNYF